MDGVGPAGAPHPGLTRSRTRTRTRTPPIEPEPLVHTLLTTTVQQQLVADRQRRFRDAADRSRRHRAPVAPDLIRTADLGHRHLLPGEGPSAVRVGDAVAA